MSTRTHLPPTTIDEVVATLDRIIADGRATDSRNTYFAALYRGVTVEVARWIAEGRFDDGARMARLDVAFANRYLDACAARADGRAMTGAWRMAFDAAESWWPVVLQHLLLGMNAHINLDLGIAAARTAPGAAIDTLQGDFVRINQVLAALVDDTRARLTTIWPRLRWVERWEGRDEAIINFSMTKARDCAWDVARRLAPLEPAAQEAEIARLDREIAALGRRVWKPGFGPLRWALVWVRLGEPRSVDRIIDALTRRS